MLAMPAGCASAATGWSPAVCPSKCACSLLFSDRFQADLRTVDCSNRDLLSFPEFVAIPGDSQALLLHGNHLRSVPIFGRLPDLLHVDLSGNRLVALKTMGFEAAFNLRILDLSANRLRELPAGAFQGLFHLRELDLAANRLSAIADDAFGHLHKLESLRLTENRLTYLHPQWWSPLQSLYALDLKQNALSLIQPATFEPLGATLRTLDLAENRLFYVNPTGFAALSRLEYLDLQGNSLGAVPAALDSLKSLRSLNLSRNPIGRIRRLDFADIESLRDLALIAMPRLQIVEPQAFSGLRQLILVAMHDNPRLTFVDSKAFSGCPALTHLLLHNNNLATLDERLLASLPALESISFYRNPLRCDCGLVWLGDRLRNSADSLEFQEAAHMVCDAPDEHKFKVLMQLQPTELQAVDCQPHILPLFDAELQRKIGDDLILDCVAGGGRSPPRTYWITPDESAVAAATLALTHIRVEQAGRYICVAESSETGHRAASRSIFVSVVPFDVRLEVGEVQATSASLRWFGADRNRQIYQILMRSDSVGHRLGYAGTVTPSMEEFRLRDLQPNTAYVVCLAYESPSTSRMIDQLDCVTFATPNLQFLSANLVRSSNVAVGLVLGVIACMLIVVCLAVVLMKRSRYPPPPTDGQMSPFFDSSILVPSPNGVENSSNGNLYTPLFVRQFEFPSSAS